jgi:hypothetical protein
MSAVSVRPPVFKLRESNFYEHVWAVADLLQDLVKQNKTGRWRWATGKQIDDASTLKAIESRVRFEEFDAATNTWKLIPCPMGYAMQVRSGLAIQGGRRP